MGKKYTEEEMIQMIHLLKEEALTLAMYGLGIIPNKIPKRLLSPKEQKWRSKAEGAGEMVLDQVFINFLKTREELNAEGRTRKKLIPLEMEFKDEKAFKSFYLDAIRKHCMTEWKKNLTTDQRRRLDERQKEKRAVKKQYENGELTFIQWKEAQQKIDDQYNEDCFYGYGGKRSRFITDFQIRDEDGSARPMSWDDLPDMDPDTPLDKWKNPITERVKAKEMLAMIWAELTKKERELLTMRYVDGLSVKEINKRKGTGAGVRLSKIKEKNRKTREKIDQSPLGRLRSMEEIEAIERSPDFLALFETLCGEEKRMTREDQLRLLLGDNYKKL